MSEPEPESKPQPEPGGIFLEMRTWAEAEVRKADGTLRTDEESPP